MLSVRQLVNWCYSLKHNVLTLTSMSQHCQGLWCTSHHCYSPHRLPHGLWEAGKHEFGGAAHIPVPGVEDEHGDAQEENNAQHGHSEGTKHGCNRLSNNTFRKIFIYRELYIYGESIFNYMLRIKKYLIKNDTVKVTSQYKQPYLVLTRSNRHNCHAVS